MALGPLSSARGFQVAKAAAFVLIQTGGAIGASPHPQGEFVLRTVGTGGQLRLQRQDGATARKLDCLRLADQSKTACDGYSLSAAPGTQLAVDAAQMRANRRLRNEEVLRDLIV